MSCSFANIVIVSKNYLCRLLFLEFFFFFFFFFLSGDRLWEGDLAEQINMNSSEYYAFSCLPLNIFIYFRKHDKKCPTIHLTAEPPHFGNWPFPFPLPFRLSLLFLPFAPRGEFLIKGGAASRDRAEGTPLCSFRWWDMKCEISARKIEVKKKFRAHEIQLFESQWNIFGFSFLSLSVIFFLFFFFIVYCFYWCFFTFTVLIVIFNLFFFRLLCLLLLLCNNPTLMARHS